MKYLICVLVFSSVLTLVPDVKAGEPGFQNEIVDEMTNLHDSRRSSPYVPSGELVSPIEMDLQNEAGVGTPQAQVVPEEFQDSRPAAKPATKSLSKAKTTRQSELQALQEQKAGLIKALKERAAVAKLKKEIKSLKKQLASRSPVSKKSRASKKSALNNRHTHVAFQDRKLAVSSDY